MARHSLSLVNLSIMFVFVQIYERLWTHLPASVHSTPYNSLF